MKLSLWIFLLKQKEMNTSRNIFKRWLSIKRILIYIYTHIKKNLYFYFFNKIIINKYRLIIRKINRIIFMLFYYRIKNKKKTKYFLVIIMKSYIVNHYLEPYRQPFSVNFFLKSLISWYIKQKKVFFNIIIFFFNN